jgi:CHRD domain-containing protein
MSAFTKVTAVIAASAALLLAGCGGNDDNQPSNTVVKAVTLSGAEENPSVTTAAAATGSFTFDTNTGAVSGSVTTFGLTGSAAHIHDGPVGVNAPVIVPMAQGPAGVWSVPAGSTLSVPQIESLQAGNLYANVHTAANPGGEIRAQIGRHVFFSTLTGAQEAPAVTTTASGSGRFVFDPGSRTLSGSVTTTGITGTVAHVHTGAVGVAGPVTIPMTGGPTWTLPPTVLTEAQVADLLGGLMYANVHSAVNPGGEIRGQLFKTVRRATLTGAGEVPPVTTSASGTCWVSVNPITKAVAGRIETTLTAGSAAHVHRGASTVAGPVVIPMTSPSPGVWVIAAGTTITDELLARFMEGNLYCNVHSAANPGGEIRGQLQVVQ